MLQKEIIKDLDQLEFKWLLITTYLNKYAVVQKRWSDDLYRSGYRSEFLRDPDKNFREKEIENFDIIYKSIRGEKVPEKYETVQDNRVKQYSQEHKDKCLSAAFRTDRKDLYFEKEVIQFPFSSLRQKK